MAKAPLPREFPGEFFVLVWDRDRETYRVELDDEQHSSYDLGSDPNGVASTLRLRGFTKAFRESAVDIAREFGVAQCIPAQERVLPIFDRTPKTPALTFFEEPTSEWTPDL